MLEREEQASLREPAKSADINKDGVITSEELASHLSNPSRRVLGASGDAGADDSDDNRERDRPGWLGFRSGNRDGDSDDDESASELAGGKAKRVYLGSTGGKKDADEKDNRNSYRFTPAKERLPTGLPGFFSRDANRDGQISMHEYSRSWSSRMVGEFRRSDTNDDGVITAKEAVKK
jgi:hypothetical protein